VIEAPDSLLVNDLFASPNIEPRLRGLTPSILVLHYTGLPTVEKSLEILSRPDCKVSCHYVIGTEGRIYQMVAEDKRAWHAGLSSWQGETDINSASIGIEIQNAGINGGTPDFPAVQMKAVAALSNDIMKRNAIRKERVLAHSDVAPSRKTDPGEKFDWRGLAKRGVGHWVAPVPVMEDDFGFGLGDSNSTIREAQRLLKRYGYGIDETGHFDEATRFVVRAFQLHFRQRLINQRLDRSTLATLERLIEALPPVEVG
jgi:N-acetylmuramoyl-L-alanine amidase